MDNTEFCSMDFSETESENKETEKEEKDEKEKELFRLIEWLGSIESNGNHVLIADNLRFESLAHDIPSPPPDSVL